MCVLNCVDIVVCRGTDDAPTQQHNKQLTPYANILPTTLPHLPPNRLFNLPPNPRSNQPSNQPSHATSNLPSNLPSNLLSNLASPLTCWLAFVSIFLFPFLSPFLSCLLTSLLVFGHTGAFSSLSVLLSSHLTNLLFALISWQHLLIAHWHLKLTEQVHLMIHIQ